MTTISKRQRIVRRTLGALSLTGALFVFQACYGPPQDMGNDIYIYGTVKAKNTGLPIEGIKVHVDGEAQYVVTDSLGKYEMYVEQDSAYKISFEDIDSSLHGTFVTKDTIMKDGNGSINLDVMLDEQ